MIALVAGFLLLVLLLAVLWLTIPYKWCSRRNVALTKKLPGPNSLPVIGNAYILIGLKNCEILPLLKKLSRDYYPIFKYHFCGHVHVVIQTVEDIEKVLCNSQNISKSFDYKFLRPWLRTGLLTSTGNKWHARRKLLTSAFHFKILEDYLPVFNRNSAVLVKQLWEHVNDPYIPMNDFTSLCTLDIICETAMGTEIHSQTGGAKDYVDAVHRMSELIQLRQRHFWVYNNTSYKLSMNGREQARLLKILHNFTERVIQERRAEYWTTKKLDPSIRQTKKKLALLDLLIEVSENGEQLTDTDIQEEVDTFMFEGHDTTSSNLAWAMFLLGLHLDIQEKVMEEQNEIFGDSDRQATFEDIQQMKYLERVIKETLRLYPSVPGISRMLDTDLELSGYTIPAGTNCPILTLVMHRNPDIWPEPDKFNPDRFLPEAVQNRHPFAYLPFSAGPRNCIGQRFALIEEKVILSNVLRNFRLHSLDDIFTVKPLLELVMRPKEPLRIQIFPRKMIL